MSEFFSMGGYGAYVWISYGLTALALFLLFLWSWFGARARETELDQIRKISRSGRQTPSPESRRDADIEKPGVSPAGDVTSGAN